MGVIDLAPDSENTYVEIITKDQNIINRFNDAMEDFKI